MEFQDNPSHPENQGSQIPCNSIFFLHLNCCFLYVVVAVLIIPLIQFLTLFLSPVSLAHGSGQGILSGKHPPECL